MHKIFSQKVILILLVAMVLPLVTHAAALTSLSDALSRLTTSIASNHTIQFTTPSGVAAGERIDITFATGFDLSSITFSDVDVSGSSTGSVTLAASPSGTTWGVSVSGQTLRIESGTGTFTAGEAVTVLIGTHTTVGGVGTNQITNPPTAGSREITVGGTFADSGSLYVPVVRNDRVSIAALVVASTASSSGSGDETTGGDGISGVRRVTPGVCDTVQCLTDQGRQIVVTGHAYPEGVVSLYIDNTLVGTFAADRDGDFGFVTNQITPGEHVLTLVGEDVDGRRSPPIVVPIFIENTSITYVSELFIAPTISFSQEGETIIVSGYTVPYSTVVIRDPSTNEIIATVLAASNGLYAYEIDILTEGDVVDETFLLQSQVEFEDQLSAVSRTIFISPQGLESDQAFDSRITIPVTTIEPLLCMKGDVTYDFQVGLADLSRVLFVRGKALDDELAYLDKHCLNNDGMFTLADLSIIAYYWGDYEPSRSF